MFSTSAAEATALNIQELIHSFASVYHIQWLTYPSAVCRVVNVTYTL